MYAFRGSATFKRRFGDFGFKVLHVQLCCHSDHGRQILRAGPGSTTPTGSCASAQPAGDPIAGEQKMGRRGALP